MPRASRSRRSQREIEQGQGCRYSHVGSRSIASAALATVTVRGPAGAVPASVEAAHALGAEFWPLALARELDDAILHLRSNEPTIGLVVFRTEGDAQAVLAHDALLRRAKATG